ncbi:MAG: hypothetical protein IKB45_03540 [Clostridia bacterium]|nr:hypothetical protein [Clostridia bacterium]
MAKKASQIPDNDFDVSFENETEQTVFESETDEMEDIYSSKPQTVIKEKAKSVAGAVAAKKYTSAAVSHMDKVVKSIAFLVAFGILLFFAAIAALLLVLDMAFMIIAAAVMLLGIIFALIFLFLIYGMGQIISQNNEILKKLK